MHPPQHGKPQLDAHKAYGLELVKQHKREIAKAIADQIEQNFPAVKDIDSGARLGNVLSVINALEGVLSGSKSMGPVMELVKQITTLRRMAGLSTRTLVASTHCYAPVARRVIVARASDPLRGLHAYEALESDFIRLLIEATAAMLPDEGGADDEEEDTITEPRRRRVTLAPFTEY